MERQLKRQCDTKDGWGLDSVVRNGEDHAVQDEQHDAAVHRDSTQRTGRSRGSATSTAAGASTAAVPKAMGTAAEGEQHDAAAHCHDPRSGEAAGEAARHEKRPEY